MCVCVCVWLRLCAFARMYMHAADMSVRFFLYLCVRVCVRVCVCACVLASSY